MRRTLSLLIGGNCFLLLVQLAMAQGSNGHAKSQDRAAQEIVMYLEIGTLSEISIPEPYTTVQIPVQIVEMRDVPGRNKKVITVHPVVTQRTRTNIRIYTQHYSFNIKLHLNWGTSPVTDLLELGNFVNAQKPWAGVADNSNPPEENGTANSSPPPAGPQVTDFTIPELLVAKPQLLEPDSKAPAIVKNRMVLAVDDVFHHLGKLVFKATLWNKSKVPYNILDLTITYRERSGVPLVNRRDSKSIRLTPFYKEYSTKNVGPGQRAHIVFATSKMSPQDDGFFHLLLLEKNGTRNFSFEIPSRIK